MMRPTAVVGEGHTMTVRVPNSIRRRGGRKLVLAPDGAEMSAAPVCRHIDNAMVKALARAFRWRGMLESGAFATVEEIAEAEKINSSYVSRVLRLTLLAPNIVESILDGRQPNGLTQAVLMRPFPKEWGCNGSCLHEWLEANSLYPTTARSPLSYHEQAWSGLSQMVTSGRYCCKSRRHAPRRQQSNQGDRFFESKLRTGARS